jgi:NAD(P)-dependent dehydrogenase (short-subunit alcohol dehydrogenase family)
MNWSTQSIASQQGRTVLITGANSGIGFEAAKVLAEKGARVVMACRNEEKARAAMARIRADVPQAELTFLSLDLSSQARVHEAAKSFLAEHDTLDLLINNAGVMWVRRSLTEDGFETQFGTNHLGHFTLTGLLLPALLATPGSRVVTVSSLAHKSGSIHFDDSTLEKGYGRHKAYAQSKLANLMFAIELDRRLKAAGQPTLSVACHPGGSNTNLADAGLVRQGGFLMRAAVRFIWPLVTQSASQGAWPTLYAATAPLNGGEYIGPKNLFETSGPPTLAKARRYARVPELGAKLWVLSEQLTGTHFLD